MAPSQSPREIYTNTVTPLVSAPNQYFSLPYLPNLSNTKLDSDNPQSLTIKGYIDNDK